MSDQDSFPALNLTILKNLSKNWCKRFPCIQDVSLYKSFEGANYKYCLVITAPGIPEMTHNEKINIEVAAFKFLEGYDEDDDIDIIRSRWGHVFWEPYVSWSYYMWDSDCYDQSFRARLYNEPAGPWINDFTHALESIPNPTVNADLAEKIATMFYHNYGNEYLMHCIEHEPGIYKKGSFSDGDWYFFYLYPNEIEVTQAILEHHIDDVDNSVTLYKKNIFASFPVNRITENVRSFALFGETWLVIFDGETTTLKDSKPIRYILEVIRNHGKKMGYIELGQLLSNNCEVDKEPREDGLSHDVNIANKHTKDEKDKMKTALSKVYVDYVKYSDKHKDKWKESKKFAESEYGILIIERDGELQFKDSKWQQSVDEGYEKVRKTVSANKTRFMKKLEESGCQKLYEHFKSYLVIIDNGIIYNPPKDSPTWNISDK